MVKAADPIPPRPRITIASAKTKASGDSTGPAAASAWTAPASVAVMLRTIPSPPTNLEALVKRITWSTNTVIHRIHREEFSADEFNPGPGGNARFSPIVDAADRSIATIYGGTTLECAAMETVFHDVPHAPGLKTVAKRKLKKHQHSQLLPSASLTLADLGSTALRKLGIPRVDLIDSEKDIYPQTRKWAEAIHAQCPSVQGLTWVSRQDDSARAIILFKDRLPPNPLRSVSASVDIVVDLATYTALVDLADIIGVKITGK
jgi:hypothetical protein